jgi:hypothetical protein
VFLVNSRFPLVSAAHPSSQREVVHPNRPSFSRSYGGILPSSLTTVLSIALVFSTRPPELVWGTGTVPTNNDTFLGSMGSMTSPVTARLRVSDLYGARIYLVPVLHTYPQTTNAGAHLPSSVLPLLPAPGSISSPESSPLVPRIGMDADTVVPEYQPVVHRLRLPASP